MAECCNGCLLNIRRKSSSAMAKLREDVRHLRFWRSLTAEFLGTLFLVLFGCGAWTELDKEGHLFTVKVALTFGLTYAAILYCVRGLGDSHINPAITLAMLATRRISVVGAALFAGCQLFGGILGAAFVRAVTPDYERTARGCNRPAAHVSDGQGFGVEFFASFFFVFVVFACYDQSQESGPRSRDVEEGVQKRQVHVQATIAPFMIGATYAGVLLFAIPYTGGSVNTARSFGPSLVNNIWTSHWIFWFGPLLGGVAGGGFYDLIFSTRASFERLRSCLFVFHRRDDKPPGELKGTDAEKGGEEYLDDGTEDRKDSILTGHDDVINDDDDVKRSSTPPVERNMLEDSQKSRLKFFWPKFPSFQEKKKSPSPAPAPPS